MTIEKLPSGSYRITQMEKGKRYRITVSMDHKPTNAEAVKLIGKVMNRKPPKVNMTFNDACNAFIESKDNILSPSTVREYKRTKERIPVTFSCKNINDITSLDIQTMVNGWSADLAPKTVRNYYAFVSAVLKSVEIELKTPQLPQKDKHTPYIPSQDDVRAVQKQFIGTKYEIPFFLLCLGLRRSELCALTIDDLSGNTLTIDKALVQNTNKEWVVKKTKTTESTRTVVIPKEIANKIREQGYIYNGSPTTLYTVLIRAQKKAEVPQFKLHALRHFFCSYMHDLGYSDKQIQEMGGWKTSYTIDTVYKHAMNMDDVKEEMAYQISIVLRVFGE